MKKILIGTTALVAAGLVAPGAQAAEKISLGLGGFMQQWVGFAEQDDSYQTGSGTDYASFDTKQDTEVYFQGSTKLDNGLTLLAHIQLEAMQSEAERIDEGYLKITSAQFGELILGKTKSTVLRTRHVAPNVGMQINIGTLRDEEWIISPAAVTNSLTTGITAADNQRVIYATPRFQGFGLVADWTPSTTTDETQPDESAETSEWAVAAVYDNTIGGVKLGANLGYYEAMSQTTTTEMDAWTAGLNVGYAGFTVGGSYDNYDDPGVHSTNTAGSTDGYAWDIGASYATGPYAVSVTYFASDTEGMTTVAGNDEYQAFALSGSYAMGPGVALKGSVLWADYEDGDSTAVNGNNNDGWAAVAGLTLAF